MSSGENPRVLQIIKGLDIGGKNGGSENFGIRLARQLRQDSLPVSLCAYYRHNTAVESGWVEQLTQEGIPVVFANHSARTDLWEGSRSLARFLQSTPVDIIHSHFQVGTITSLFLKLFGKAPRIIRTAHTPVEFGSGIVGQAARIIFVSGMYPFLIDQEVGVSQGIVRSLDSRWLARLAGKKSPCIHNALSEANHQGAAVSPFAPFIQVMDRPPWVITMIGILNPLKNFDVAIRAMPAVLAEQPHARLVVVGKGPEEERLKRLAVDIGVKDQVWFLGQRSDISEILAHTDLFVLPSVIEAMSTVILEAMQCGVPVAAADIPGNRELITNGINGWLFSPKSPQTLAQTVLDAYRNPERGRAYVQQSYQRLDKYKMSTVSRQYVELYRQLISTGVS